MQDVSKARMIRKQVFIRTDQNRRLKAMAAQQGVSEGELIRTGISLLLEQAAGAEADWKSAWRQAAGIWKDYPEVEQKIAKQRKGWGRRLKRLGLSPRGRK
jgi:hypothetical protein